MSPSVVKSFHSVASRTVSHRFQLNRLLSDLLQKWTIFLTWILQRTMPPQYHCCVAQIHMPILCRSPPILTTWDGSSMLITMRFPPSNIHFYRNHLSPAPQILQVRLPICLHSYNHGYFLALPTRFSKSWVSWSTAQILSPQTAPDNQSSRPDAFVTTLIYGLSCQGMRKPQSSIVTA